MSFQIAALYRFVSLPDPQALRDELRAAFCENDPEDHENPKDQGDPKHQDQLCGTLLLAPEGINGTLAGSPAAIDRLLDLLAQRTGLNRAEVKFSSAEERPFGRLKFLLKREIIAFRKAVVDPTQAGRYVTPQEWNTLIADPEVLLLDTRNHYETEFGTFAGATDPGIDTFSDFVTYVRENLDPARHRKIAMFCTGGIRCEKASAFMLQQGFSEVYHLQGGILKYLEEVPQQASKWEGTCFVFDRRVSVGHEDFTPAPNTPDRNAR